VSADERDGAVPVGTDPAEHPGPTGTASTLDAAAPARSGSGGRTPSLRDVAAEDFDRTRLFSKEMLLDSGLPTVVFVAATAIPGTPLRTAILAAVLSGVVVAAVRLVRRESLQHVLAGFVGLLLAAWLAGRSGEAEQFFLPGIVINAAYLLAYLVSILVGWPLIGVVVGFVTGEGTTWRGSPVLLRAYTLASWCWVGMFAVRLAVQVPLYLGDEVVALGVARLALGWPLFLLTVYVSWVLVSRARAAAVATEPA
jgi:hypothetical protein